MRKIIWFNPPYNLQVKTNIGRTFLAAINKRFPPSHKYHKIFNKNTIKLSYSCTPNIKAAISKHNKRILSTPEISCGSQSTRQKCSQPAANGNRPPASKQMCNCRDPTRCPMVGSCLEQCVIYKATVSSSEGEKHYIGATELTFKSRFTNHKESFLKQSKSSSTTLSKHIWNLKGRGISYTIKWEIIRRCPLYKCGTRRCDLCLSEKYFILQADPDHCLNRNFELLQKCRHSNKFKLGNFSKTTSSNVPSTAELESQTVNESTTRSQPVNESASSDQPVGDNAGTGRPKSDSASTVQQADKRTLMDNPADDCPATDQSPSVCASTDWATVHASTDQPPSDPKDQAPGSHTPNHHPTPPPPPRTSRRATTTQRGSQRTAASQRTCHWATATQRISHSATPPPPTGHWSTAPVQDSPHAVASPPATHASTNLQTTALPKTPTPQTRQKTAPSPAHADHEPTHSSQVILSTSLTNAERMLIANNREELDDSVTTKAMGLVMKAVPHLSIQPTSLSSLPEELRYSEEDTIFIHHIESQHHFVMSTSLGGAARTFDSLNLPQSHMLERQVEAIYQPRDPNQARRRVQHPRLEHTQAGSTDCGVYAIAYAVEVALGTDPGELPTISYQRHQMRRHLLDIFHTQRVARFPRSPTTRLARGSAPRAIGCPATTTTSSRRADTARHSRRGRPPGRPSGKAPATPGSTNAACQPTSPRIPRTRSVNQPASTRAVQQPPATTPEDPQPPEPPPPEIPDVQEPREPPDPPDPPDHQ